MNQTSADSGIGYDSVSWDSALAPPLVAGGDWTYAVLHTFGRAGDTGDGRQPLAPLAQDGAGDLFGTTVDGGGPCASSHAGCGTVFRVTPPPFGTGGVGGYEVVYRFAGGSDGWDPYSGLVVGSSGALFGTTILGGSQNPPKIGDGTVFRLKPPAAGSTMWTKTVLHNFHGVGDGRQPGGQLALDAAGNLFGTAGFRGGFHQNRGAAIFDSALRLQARPAGR